MHANGKVTDIRSSRQRSDLPPTREGAWPAVMHLTLAMAPPRQCDAIALTLRLLDHDVDGMLVLGDGDLVIDGHFFLELTPGELVELISELNSKRARR